MGLLNSTISLPVRNIALGLDFPQKAWRICNKAAGISDELSIDSPDSKVHRANMGPTWVLLAPDGPHVGSMNLAIREVLF